MVLSILLLFSLFGCASSSSKVDNYFEPYIEVFQQDCLKYRKDCEVSTKFKFKNLTFDGRKIAGVCLRDKNMIYIDLQGWLTLPPVSRQLLVTHELLHCGHFNQNHRSGMHKGIPLSLMFYAIIPEEYFILFREEYLKEAFLEDESDLIKSIDEIWRD